MQFWFIISVSLLGRNKMAHIFRLTLFMKAVHLIQILMKEKGSTSQ